MFPPCRSTTKAWIFFQGRWAFGSASESAKGISAAERLDTISKKRRTGGMLYENSDEPYCEGVSEGNHG